MFKTFGALLFLFALVVSADSRAADNLVLTRYMEASEVPSSFLSLGGGSNMTSKSYQDDDNKKRSDKVYYTTTHSYSSSYRMEDITRLMNPADGRLGDLFEETTIARSAAAAIYDVMMGISTPIKNFDCASKLSFKNFKSGAKNVFVYSFSNFNMVFTDMVIQVEVEAAGSGTKIKLSQIAAVKGSTYSKLKRYLAVGKFEKALKENIRKFKDGVGGV